MLEFFKNLSLAVLGLQNVCLKLPLFFKQIPKE